MFRSVLRIHYVGFAMRRPKNLLLIVARRINRSAISWTLKIRAERIFVGQIEAIVIVKICLHARAARVAKAG